MAEALFEKVKDRLAKLPVKDQVVFHQLVKDFVHQSVLSEQRKKEEEANELQSIADRIGNVN